MLTMAARQLGYWHATPEGESKSRAQEAREDGIEPSMPELEGMRRLWDAWHECGRVSEGGPLAWAEVEAFARLRGLDPEDAVALRQMSEAYLEGLALTSRLAIMPMEVYQTYQ